MPAKEDIRRLNDILRQTGAGGKTVITPAVQALSDIDKMRLVSLVRTFNEFGAANNPHEEHDFGIVKLHGESYYWKIDYYDNSLKWGSENPADPSVTSRILTILHSCEY